MKLNFSSHNKLKCNLQCFMPDINCSILILTVLFNVNVNCSIQYQKELFCLF